MAIHREPAQLVIQGGETPSIKLEGVELRSVVERLQVDMSGGGVWLTLVCPVDVEFDFPVNHVTVAKESDPLAGITAEEIDCVINECGYATRPADALLRHLRQR